MSGLIRHLMKVGLVTCASLFVVLTGSASADCNQQWSDAEQNMHSSCNALNVGKNQICYANRPVELFPPVRNNGFVAEGQIADFPHNFERLTGTSNGQQIGFSFLKLLTGGLEGAGNERVPIYQQVIMISFGNTRLADIKAQGDRMGLWASQTPLCTGVMYEDRPVFVKSRSLGGQDIYMVQQTERVNVLGQNASRSALLVQIGQTVTGWLDADEAAFLVNECPVKDSLPIYSDDLITRNLQNLQMTTEVSRFSLVNSPGPDVSEELQCSLNGIAPSGLLIINPSSQLLMFVVDGVEVIMASSVLVTNYYGVMSVYVLEGRVRLRFRSGRSQVARAGQVIRVAPRGDDRPRVVPESVKERRMPWCNRLERLVTAALGGRGRLRVPHRRLRFCRNARQGYPVHPLTFQKGLR